MKLDAADFYIAGATAVFVMLGAQHAVGHDIYNGVRDPRGVLCCGGDPITGDCEGLADEFIKVQSDGSAVLFSKRYGAWIKVSRDIITWMTIPGDNGVNAGHYCGKPRAPTVPTADQPDPSFNTFCVFITPYGT